MIQDLGSAEEEAGPAEKEVYEELRTKSTEAIKSEMGTVEGVVTVILPQPHQLHCPPHLQLKLKMIHTQQIFSSL